MGSKKLLRFIPVLLFSAFLIGAPTGNMDVAHAADKAPAAAKKAKNVYKGKVLGKSNKAKTISIKVGKKTEMVKFDANTKGIEHATKGHAAIIKFEVRGNDKYATVVKPKLAKLPKGVTEMQPGDLVKLVAMGPEKGNYALLDARPTARYHEGTIPTAKSLPVGKMKKTGATYLPGDAKLKNTLLVFFCGGPT